jgi:anti-sigma regulatory factor (Ser/Thr protein kinase)
MELGSQLLGSYRAVPESPAEARKRLQPLRSSLDEEAFDDLLLLVTELLTNSINHAGLGPDDYIEVSVALRDPCIHVRVSDRGIGFSPGSQVVDQEAVQGRGLTLVRRIADRWGLADEGSTVWFDLPMLPVSKRGAHRRLR